MVMSESIEQRLERVRVKFADFTAAGADPDDKWKYLLDLAKAHKGMDPSLKAEKFIIQGCAATMYLVPNFDGERIHFEMDVDPAFFQEIGLNVGLSPTRSNGFASLVKQIYLYARVFAALCKK